MACCTREVRMFFIYLFFLFLYLLCGKTREYLFHHMEISTGWSVVYLAVGDAAFHGCSVIWWLECHIWWSVSQNILSNPGLKEAFSGVSCNMWSTDIFRDSMFSECLTLSDYRDASSSSLVVWNKSMGNALPRDLKISLKFQGWFAQKRRHSSLPIIRVWGWYLSG